MLFYFYGEPKYIFLMLSEIFIAYIGSILIANYKNKSILSQIMLIPATVSLAPTLFETVSENKEFFASLGFEIDDFGDNVVIVRKIPAALEGCGIDGLIVEIAEILQNKSKVDLTDLSEISLHTMACKRAIKKNNTL